jgi:hypothetical protein
MGILSDLVLATEAELLAVPRDQAPVRVLPGIDIKGVDSIKLCTLHGLMTGAEFDPDLKDFPEVGASGSEDGPWLFRCPDDLFKRLSALDDAAARQLAEAWAQTEDFLGDGWPAEAVVECFHRIRAFANEAVASRKPVHLWVSL